MYQEENNPTFSRGLTMLKNAVKKYEEGDIEGGNKDREIANDLMDKSSFEEQPLDDIKLYGENRNFGIIYHIIEENIKNSYKDKKKMKSIASILKHIKNNNILKEQYDIYTSLKSARVNNGVDSYINEAVTILPRLNKKNVVKSNKELINLIRKNNINEMVGIEDNTIKLYEAIEFLLLNTKNLSNIDKFNLNKNVLKEYIENNKPTVDEGKKITKEDYIAEYNKIISELSEHITEDEELLLKELNENDHKTVFEKYKNETIKLISEQVSISDNIEDKMDWNSLLTRLSLKQFNENRFLEDIKDFVETQNIINE